MHWCSSTYSLHMDSLRATVSVSLDGTLVLTLALCHREFNNPLVMMVCNILNKVHYSRALQVRRSSTATLTSSWFVLFLSKALICPYFVRQLRNQIHNTKITMTVTNIRTRPSKRKLMKDMYSQHPILRANIFGLFFSVISYVYMTRYINTNRPS